MLFTSFGFILFFILLFILYYTAGKKFQWQLLLCAGVIFYAFSGLSNMAYIAVTILSTYLCGLKIGALYSKQDLSIKEIGKDEKKQYKAKMKVRRKRWLILCFVFNLGILAVIKYTAFIVSNINGLIKTEITPFKLLLPMGISFYTFQSVGYIVDVYRKKHEPEQNFFKYALFVSFFPQLIQGPISRFSDLSKTLFNKHEFDQKKIIFGFWRILTGFFKKLVIADRLLAAYHVMVSDTSAYQGAYVLVVMLFYAVALFCDFTGGIDITIGCAEMLGIRLTENFNGPFYSKSIKEYWRRWHITMGEWFKDYVFYPLSVSKPMLRLSTVSRARLGDALGKRIPVYISTLVTWFLTGLWHGASWNFIAWGLANGIVILVSQELTPFYEAFNKRFNFTKTKGYQFFMIVRTFVLMCFIRTFDCYNGVSAALKMFYSLFKSFNAAFFLETGLLGLGLDVKDYAVIIAGVAALITASVIKIKGSSVKELLWQKPVTVKYFTVFFLFFIILIFGVYGVGYDSRQFIYNQF